jgi:tetratricopeptide (TPR) repeat protein
VYGGGAITPDVVVKDGELPPFASFLLARNVYSNFAVDYARRHRRAIESIDWRPGPELEGELRDWVVAEKIATAEEAAKASEDLRAFSLLQVRAEILNVVFGQEARHRALAEDDVQLQAALKLFDRAAALQAQRQALGTSEPDTGGASASPARSAAAPAVPAVAPAGAPYQVQLALAKLLAMEGSVEAALSAFEEAERRAPEAPYVHLEHALLLDRIAGDTRLPADRRADSLRRAAASIDAAQRLAPENLDVLRAAGEVYTDLAGVDPAARVPAIAALEAVRRQDPADVPATLSLARLRVEDEPELVVPLLRDFVARVPRQRTAYALLAEALLRSNQDEEAEAVLGEILSIDPASEEARLTLADLQSRRGDHDAALATLRAAPEEQNDEPRLRRGLGWELYWVGLAAEDWDGAVAALTPLLEIEDEATRHQAELLRADAQMRAKRYDAVLAGLQSSGTTPDVERLRAEALYRAGRESEARAALEALAARGDAEAAIAAAQTWQRLSLYGDSIPVLETTVAAHPDSVAAWFLLGAARERTGQRQPAAAALRRSLELQPDFHASLNYLAYILAEAGESLEEALGLAQRAVALEPDNGAYVDSLGFTCYRLGRHEEARGYLERAVRLDPSDPSIHEHLADVYVALHRNEQAREAYRRALELGSDTADEVRRKLAALDGSGDRPRS